MPLHRRLPKRGFNHQKRFPKSVINVDVLCRIFDDGAEVTTETLIAKGLVESCKGGVKVLARGEADKKLNLKVEAISPTAQAKIEAAGGTVTLVSAKVEKESDAPAANAAQKASAVEE